MVLAKSRKVRPHVNNSVQNMAYTWSPGPEPPNPELGVPRAIFTPHTNSLLFEERRVSLEQPVKIGRNVYRATPCSTNTIFECRVLSRHHATLWYEKGHFYIMDNQSSNGTFINNNRCSISKDSEPHEVFSGDIVQFGIAVVECNAEKNTFPPVVALLKLYHPDGKEAKLSFNPTMTTPLHLKELYQLNNYVQEAVQREVALEARLRTLRECVERTRAEAQSSWELLVGEQRLLARVHALEGSLAIGKQPEQQHVAQLLDDKRNYQHAAQECLREAHEQRLALEETLERRSREAQALHQYNCSLRLAANNALAELQKLAARCERKMYAARLAIATAEEREAATRAQLPLAYSVLNGESRMLVLSADSNRLQEEDWHAATLEEAVRALPDYIKLLLPQHLLNKVGIASVSAEGKSAKEFELILKKNDLYETENREKRANKEESGDGAEEKSKVELDTELDVSTDDEKTSRLNHCDSSVDSMEVGGKNILDGEIRPDNHSDNNANSTYSDSSNHTDSPTSKGQQEYANILRVMAGLNEEIKALRERLSSSIVENEKLRSVRDELLAVKLEAQEEAEQLLHANAEEPPTYQEKLVQLEEQLARATAAGEANQAEIQRLLSAEADLQSDLAVRPTRGDVDELTTTIGRLRTEMDTKDELLERLQIRLCASEEGSTTTPLYPDKKAVSTCDKSIHTSPSLENLRFLCDDVDQASSTTIVPMGELDREMAAEIDDLFKLDYEDEIDLNYEAGDTIGEEGFISNEANSNEVVEKEEDSTSTTDLTVNALEMKAEELRSPEFVKLDDESRIEVTLQNGSLHALEEELVLAKERWAEVAAERARLAEQLQGLQRRAPGPTPWLAAAVPLLAVCLYLLLYRYVS